MRTKTQQRAASPEAGRTTLAYGVVSEIDPKLCRVRITQSDRDGVLSPWLPCLVTGQGPDRRQSYALPSIGTFGAAMLDEAGERGVWLGALWTEAEPPPQEPDAIKPTGDDENAHKHYVVFPDGSAVVYDSDAHHLALTVKGDGAHVSIRSEGTVMIEAGENVTIKAPRIDFNPSEPSAAQTRDEQIDWG